MARFINPFTDVGFKRIFGQAIHKELLIDFLNDLLVGEKRITDITFLDKELLPDFSGDRGVIYDIYCTNEDGEQFIVEMQNREQTFFRERALYYLSQAIARQRGTGCRMEIQPESRVWHLLHEFPPVPLAQQIPHGHRLVRPGYERSVLRQAPFHLLAASLLHQGRR